MLRREFFLQYLRADGEPDGAAQPMTLPELRAALALRWPRQCRLAQLEHCLALARAGTRHPVDAVAIYDDRVLFSARITHIGGQHGAQA